MRSSLWGLVLFGLLAAAPARAQDTGPEDDPARAQLLRQRIEDRFAERVKEEVGLNDEQLAKLRATSGTYGGRRRDLAAQERQVRSSLSEQMRPGVAANQDSVSKLTDALVNLRSAYAQTFREENAEMARYLTPVQRSQLMAMRERFVRRVQEIRRQRQATPGQAGPGQPLRQEMRERRQERRQTPQR
jgi:hypothetical protein